MGHTRASSGVFSRIYGIVKQIPYGRVATYGEIGRLAGSSRMARTVGWALHSNPEPGVIPCHRVVNKDGKCSGSFAFGGADAQRKLLEAEGVPFLEDGTVDMEKALWKPY
ncbi:MAG: MGMT family protein [Oscillospiraceae bacterium]|jgi:methylated-DNA-protein-cysteine methyltransferase-like protein